MKAGGKDMKVERGFENSRPAEVLRGAHFGFCLVVLSAGLFFCFLYQMRLMPKTESAETSSVLQSFASVSRAGKTFLCI